jgi:hypothetical protein
MPELNVYGDRIRFFSAVHAESPSGNFIPFSMCSLDIIYLSTTFPDHYRSVMVLPGSAAARQGSDYFTFIFCGG